MIKHKGRGLCFSSFFYIMSILEEVEHYCIQVLRKTECASHPFHNEQHTKEVVENVSIIGKQLSISSKELEPVIVSAWFHDLGFSEKYQGHEAVSATLARDFLVSQNYDEEKTNIVLSGIGATQKPQNLQNELAKVLCDAVKAKDLIEE
ncbi:MAG: HD domain-containing protein [Flavobacteriales bacterium]|nr:HD domain-containing protein [Flavobacteriales bacterium]